MTTLANTFKAEYANNNYDFWATACSIDAEDGYKLSDIEWTDSEGEKHTDIGIEFTDGSSVVAHEWDVEVI